MSWTRKFIIENLGLILSKNDLVESIRLRKKEFFHRNSLKSSEGFSLKEIAFDTLKYLIERSKIQTDQDLKRYKESCFFLNEYVTDHELQGLMGLLSPFRSSILTSEDLGKLGQEEYRQIVEKELLEKARMTAEEQLQKSRQKTLEEMQLEQKKLEELKELAEQKREEVRRMESILDSLPETFNPEDYINPEKVKELPSAPKTWWQKVGLTGDPFPTNRGLTQIPVDKYEKVIVATRIFRDYMKIIQDDPKSLFGKTILVSGQFGSGKTTLFQFLSFKLVPHQITASLIILDPVADRDLLRRNFYSEIFTYICKSLKQSGLEDPRASGAISERNTIADNLMYLAKQSHINGYVFMIDGLHKDETTIDASLEFIKQLQNFHEYLDNYGVSVSFLVAGSPLWLRRVQQNPAYSGSFYRIDEIPHLTFNDAYELLQKRIDAYASPGSPVFLDKGVIKFTYDYLSQEMGEGVTFRDFIDYILPRLTSGDFKSVGVSVQIDVENAYKIHKRLRASLIKDGYDYFRDKTYGKSKLRRACYLALRNIYKNNYLTEHDEEFIANKGAFYVLKNAQLIQKAKASDNKGFEGFGWSISGEFLKVLDDLNDEGYLPAIVFQALSIEPSEPTEKQQLFDPILDRANDFIAKWESEWPELIPNMKSFIESHNGLIESPESSENIAADCKESLLKLIQCLQIALNEKDQPEEWIQTTWLDIPDKDNIKTLLLETAQTDTIACYQRYYRASDILLEILTQLLETNRLVNIVSLVSYDEEMKAVYLAGNLFQKGEFERALEEVNARLEKRIRVIFHLAFSLQYGSNYLQYLPDGAQQRITKMQTASTTNPLKRELDQNLFYHLSRSEYADVVNNSSNWGNFFEKLFVGKRKDEVVKALRLNFALDDRVQHRDRSEYFRNHREDIRQSIINAGWLLNFLDNALRVVIQPDGYIRDEKGETIAYRISLMGQAQCSSSHPWTIDRAKYNEISERLSRTHSIVNFADDSTLTALFGGTFMEIFMIIIESLKNGKLTIHDLPDSGMYLLLSAEQK